MQSKKFRDAAVVSSIREAALPTKENAAAEFDRAQAARFWAPWLAVYTGARFTEIVRLRREDCCCWPLWMRLRDRYS